jgi:hypothetical protein
MFSKASNPSEFYTNLVSFAKKAQLDQDNLANCLDNFGKKPSIDKVLKFFETVANGSCGVTV